MKKFIKFVLLLGVTSCGTLTGVTPVREDLARLQQRVDKLSGEVVGDEGSVRDTLANLELEVSEIRVELQRLQGLIEERGFYQENQLLDIQTRLNVVEEKVLGMKHSAPTVSWKNEEEAYQDATSSYKGGNYSQSMLKFERLLQQFPDTKYKDSAFYWIGECHYALGEYDRAILKFDEVSRNFSESPKAPAALLRTGQAFLLLGKKEDARLFFQEVVRKFPDSEQAKVAEEKLKDL
ncbi:MAG: tol-pal system protein YbgF [Deltaproteobacteria bacterium]|nr:tol-pal system protein YbgF [Deltaproteobacteria bacterium]